MRWRLFLFDIIGFACATSIFLYVNPSEYGRLRLIYIGQQVLLSTLVVFLFRYYFKVYKKPADSTDLVAHDDMLVLTSDLLAGVVIYVIQFFIPDVPPVRISFVQVVCMIGINLFISVYGRQAFRLLISYCNRLANQMD